MKKLLALLLAAGLFASLAACGNDTAADSTGADAGATEPVSEADDTDTDEAEAEPTATGGKAASEITVAGLTVQEDQFSQMLNKGFIDAAADYGVNAMTANTGNDQAKELELINTYVAQGVDGVALQPLDEVTTFANLERAYGEGLEVTMVGVDLTGADFVMGGFTTAHEDLGRAAGRAAAEYIKNELDGQAKIGIVQFKSQYPTPSSDRVNGFLSEVQAVNPDVEVVAEGEAWVQDMSITVTGDMLTANPDIDVIFAANDGGTIGAVMAVKNEGLAGQTAVFGIDIGEQQIAMLRSDDNILQAAVGQDAYMMAYRSMELLIQGLMGEDIGERGQNHNLECNLLERGDDTAIDDYEQMLKEVMG